MKRSILFVLCCCLLVCATSTAWADATITRDEDSITIEGVLTGAEAAELNKEVAAANPEELTFVLEDADNATLAAICEKYPGMVELQLERSDALTSLAPLSKLKKITTLKIFSDNLSDFTPLQTLTSLKLLNLTCSAIGPNLKWMAGMTKLESITIDAGEALVSLEGIPQLPALEKINILTVSIKDLTPLTALSGLKTLSLQVCVLHDLSPLAQLSKLREVSFYQSTLKDPSTLAKLTQVEKFFLNKTDIKDLAPLKTLPNLNALNVDKGVFPEGALTGFANPKIEITER